MSVPQPWTPDWVTDYIKAKNADEPHAWTCLVDQAIRTGEKGTLEQCLSAMAHVLDAKRDEFRQARKRPQTEAGAASNRAAQTKRRKLVARRQVESAPTSTSKAGSSDFVASGPLRYKPTQVLAVELTSVCTRDETTSGAVSTTEGTLVGESSEGSTLIERDARDFAAMGLIRLVRWVLWAVETARMDLTKRLVPPTSFAVVEFSEMDMSKVSFDVRQRLVCLYVATIFGPGVDEEACCQTEAFAARNREFFQILRDHVPKLDSPYWVRSAVMSCTMSSEAAERSCCVQEAIRRLLGTSSYNEELSGIRGKINQIFRAYMTEYSRRLDVLSGRYEDCKLFSEAAVEVLQCDRDSRALGLAIEKICQSGISVTTEHIDRYAIYELLGSFLGFSRKISPVDLKKKLQAVTENYTKHVKAAQARDDLIRDEISKKRDAVLREVVPLITWAEMVRALQGSAARFVDDKEVNWHLLGLNSVTVDSRKLARLKKYINPLIHDDKLSRRLELDAISRLCNPTAKDEEKEQEMRKWIERGSAAIKQYNCAIAAIEAHNKAQAAILTCDPYEREQLVQSIWRAPLNVRWFPWGEPTFVRYMPQEPTGKSAVPPFAPERPTAASAASPPAQCDARPKQDEPSKAADYERQTSPSGPLLGQHGEPIYVPSWRGEQAQRTSKLLVAHLNSPCPAQSLTADMFTPRTELRLTYTLSEAMNDKLPWTAYVWVCYPIHGHVTDGNLQYFRSFSTEELKDLVTRRCMYRANFNSCKGQTFTFWLDKVALGPSRGSSRNVNLRWVTYPLALTVRDGNNTMATMCHFVSVRFDLSQLQMATLDVLRKSLSFSVLEGQKTSPSNLPSPRISKEQLYSMSKEMLISELRSLALHTPKDLTQYYLS